MTRRLAGGRTYQIREAEPDDAVALLEYLERVSGESDCLGFGPGEFDLTEDQEREVLLKCRSSDRDLYLVAVIGDDLVGALHFGSGARLRTRHAGEFGMSVRRTWWGSGIGGGLLDALLAWAAAGGAIGRVNLRVRTDNHAAVALYRSRGFEIEGTMRDQVRLGDESHDLHIMGRAISSGDVANVG